MKFIKEIKNEETYPSFSVFMLIIIGSSNGSTKNTAIQHTLPFTSDGLKKFYSYDENTGTYKINAQFLEKKNLPN